MPKINVTFNLPDDDFEYKLYGKSYNMHSLIREWTDFLRSKTKYGDGKLVSWEEVREAWWSTCKDEEVDPYAE